MVSKTNPQRTTSAVNHVIRDEDDSARGEGIGNNCDVLPRTPRSKSADEINSSNDSLGSPSSAGSELHEDDSSPKAAQSDLQVELQKEDRNPYQNWTRPLEDECGDDPQIGERTHATCGQAGNLKSERGATNPREDLTSGGRQGPECGESPMSRLGGKAAAIEPVPGVLVQERGDIYFWYRPRMNVEQPKGVDDVQRMYIVLKPDVAEIHLPLSENNSLEGGANICGRLSDGGVDSQQLNDEEDVRAERELRGEGGKGKMEGESDEGARKEGDKEKEKEGNADNEKSGIGGKGENRPKEFEEMAPKIGDFFEASPNRLLVVGHKTLPDPSKRSRPFWGYVDFVSMKLGEIKEKLIFSDDHETKTRGEQHLPSARIAGEGRYCILQHHKKGMSFTEDDRASRTPSYIHAHLVYWLQRPSKGEYKKGGPQDALNIAPEGSFIVQMKNPEQPSPRGMGRVSKKLGKFPAHLQALMGSLRFLALPTPEFLNYEGAEFLLISASDDIEADLGISSTKGGDNSEEESCDDFLLKGFHKEDRIAEPMVEGGWA